MATQVVAFLLPQLLQGVAAGAEEAQLASHISPVLQDFVTEWLQEMPCPHDSAQLAELSELLAAYLGHVGRLSPSFRAEALGVEVIKRRLARLSTHCYTLEQQLASGASSAETDSAVARAQAAVGQLQVSIRQIACQRVASKLQEDLKQIVNSSLFVFGFGGMQLT